MFYLIREARDYEFCSYSVIDCSEDKNDLQKKANKYNDTIKEFLSIQGNVNAEIVKRWVEVEKSVELKKIPNRKSDGSNHDLCRRLARENLEILGAARNKVREEYVNTNVPERLRPLFLKEIANGWCTKFIVVEQEPAWG